MCIFLSAWRFWLGGLKSKNLVLLKAVKVFFVKKLALLRVFNGFESQLAQAVAGAAGLWLGTAGPAGWLSKTIKNLR